MMIADTKHAMNNALKLLINSFVLLTVKIADFGQLKRINLIEWEYCAAKPKNVNTY